MIILTQHWLDFKHNFVTSYLSMLLTAFHSCDVCLLPLHVVRLKLIQLVDYSFRLGQRQNKFVDCGLSPSMNLFKVMQTFDILNKDYYWGIQIFTVNLWISFFWLLAETLLTVLWCRYQLSIASDSDTVISFFSALFKSCFANVFHHNRRYRWKNEAISILSFGKIDKRSC